MTIRSIVTAMVVALLLMPAAPASGQQAKCLAGKTGCMAKKAAGLLKCEALAETPGKPADPNAKDCVTKVQTKFDGGLEPAKGCFEKLEAKDPNDCLTVDDTGAAETAVDTCVAALVAAIDPPPLDQTQCGAGKKKCVAKYLAALLTCRKLAQTPGKPADPNTKGCVDKAVAKYTGGGDPTKGCFAKREANDPNDCQFTNDAATVQGLAEDCVEDLVGVVTGCAGEPDGTACNDGNACTTVDACQGGRCTGAAPVICEFPGQCQNAGSCDPATGQCSYPPKADGTTCSDGNACTQSDTCEGGVCAASILVVCPAAPDQCHDAACDPATGDCVTPPKADGTGCNDGNACTQGDRCVGGACLGLSETICIFSPDQCQDAGTCDPATGLCTNPAKPDGTACNDGNLCTQADACQDGVCAGTPVDCQCHTAGSTCDPSTGLCSNPPQIDGDPCDDGVTCTKDDFCFAGRCLRGLTDCPTAICSVTSCNVETGACELDQVVCRTPSDTQCFATNCQTSSGVCVTTCAAAECSTGPTGFGPCKDAFDCSTNADCQDNNICTNDVCDLFTRLCSNAPITCPDGDPTTFDYCAPKVGCVHQQLNPQELCDDHIACTLDGLDPVHNCIHTPLDDRCASTDPCEVGICDPGAGDPTTGCRFEAVPCGP